MMFHHHAFLGWILNPAYSLMLGLPGINYRLENHIFLNKTLIVECLCVEQHPILQSRMEN
ncbi:MAG: hypothetical protein RL595_1562 [Planctomycetota bacterium]